MKNRIIDRILSALLILALAMQILIVPTATAAVNGDESKKPDPNFHIYIAFGQSNMEGHEPMTDADKSVDDNFLMMQTADNMNAIDGTPKEAGKWYPAVPKLTNPNSVGVGVCDFFGRSILKLKQETNPDVKVGVIVVAVGGVGIKFFDKDVCKEEIEKADGWQQDIINNYYGGNPYQRIVDMANQAKKDGVIKGIILHQGETDAYQSYWTGEVEKVYKDMLADIGLADNVPLIAGECLRSFSGQEQNVGQNQNINKLPDINSNLHVVSSENLEGVDQWHFTHESYEEFGRRYAEKMMEVEPQYTWNNPEYEWSADNTTVKASRTCKEFPYYVEEETVNVTRTVLKQPTYVSKGLIEYISDDFKNPAFFRQRKEEVLPALKDDRPTMVPTKKPTAEPTVTPMQKPTAVPTEEPTATPTKEPTAAPTEEPTATPTEEPTVPPTQEPTVNPTKRPTVEPTAVPADNTSVQTPAAVPSNVPAQQTVSSNNLKNGDKVTVGNINYRIINQQKKTVVATGLKGNAKKVVIPATITAEGEVYKVTSIAANAFSGNKKISSVIIGKNITSIGKKAFYKCAALKKVNIKSEAIKKIGSAAFKKINKKAVIKVPKKAAKKYKKLLKIK